MSNKQFTMMVIEDLSADAGLDFRTEIVQVNGIYTTIHKAITICRAHNCITMNLQN